MTLMGMEGVFASAYQLSSTSIYANTDGLHEAASHKIASTTLRTK